MIANNGYPYVSTYALTRAVAATQGITLTRASQTIRLSQRGDERYDERDDGSISACRARSASATAASRRRSTSSTSPMPTRSSRTTVAVGPSYLLPSEILSPRIIRVGFSLDF